MKKPVVLPTHYKHLSKHSPASKQTNRPLPVSRNPHPSLKLEMTKNPGINLSFPDIIFHQGSGEVGFSLQEEQTFPGCRDASPLGRAREAGGASWPELRWALPAVCSQSVRNRTKGLAVRPASGAAADGRAAARVMPGQAPFHPPARRSAPAETACSGYSLHRLCIPPPSHTLTQPRPTSDLCLPSPNTQTPFVSRPLVPE